MSDPTENDIKVACEIVRLWRGIKFAPSVVLESHHQWLVEAISKAIADERERCLRFVEQYNTGDMDFDLHCGARAACIDIAAAIRGERT